MIESRQDPNRTGARAAFSLIELVAALALATLLTIAVLAAMRSMVTALPSAGSSSRSAGSDARLADLLRFDLNQASSIRQADGTLYLAGYSGLDASSLQPTDRPVLVAYSQRDIDGREWLMREQTALDVLSTQGTWSELVAADTQVPVVTAVPTVPIIPPDNSDATQAIVDKTPYVFRRLGMTPIPDAVRVGIARQDASALAFTLFLR
jgi:hypothetical protein